MCGRAVASCGSTEGREVGTSAAAAAAEASVAHAQLGKVVQVDPRLTPV
jgi:hypothetical protein